MLHEEWLYGLNELQHSDMYPHAEWEIVGVYAGDASRAPLCIKDVASFRLAPLT